MKKQIVLSAIVFFLGTTILSASPAFYQQGTNTVHQDNKDINHDRTQLAKNRAQRNRDEKKGDPKKAANKQRQVNHDKKDLHQDVKARNAAEHK